MNTKLRQKAKNYFEKNFFKLMNDAVFGKTMENVRKNKNIKLATTERGKKLFSVRTKFSYYKVFHREFFSNRNEKREILMNKPVHLGLSVIELSKILMYEFLYDYVKKEYGEKVKLSYKDTESFIVYIKADDIYKDIAEDVKTRFNTSN